MNDLEEFKRAEAEADDATRRVLGARPSSNPQACILIGVAVYVVLSLFSAVTDSYETSGYARLIFAVLIAGGSYWYQLHRENRWNKMRREISAHLHRGSDPS